MYGADRDVLIAGVIKNDSGGPSAIAGLNEISRLRVGDNGSGTLKYTPDSRWSGRPLGADVLWAGNTVNQVPGGVNSYEKTGDQRLWQYTATVYAIGNDVGLNGMFWYTQENYLIGDGGGVKQVGDLTNSSLDPFSLLKSIAGESIISIKQSNLDLSGPDSLWSKDPLSAKWIYNDIVQNSEYFNGVNANIDLVFIPDLAVAAVQRMLPAITKLNE